MLHRVATFEKDSRTRSGSGPERLAESNADQVEKIHQVLKRLSLDIATQDEARQILSLKGVDQVAF